jgi:hypothetical protein
MVCFISVEHHTVQICSASAYVRLIRRPTLRSPAATTLGAIDLGYRVILLNDAICSGADETHDASLELLGDRFSVQLELMTTNEFLSVVA